MAESTPDTSGVSTTATHRSGARRHSGDCGLEQAVDVLALTTSSLRRQQLMGDDCRRRASARSTRSGHGRRRRTSSCWTQLTSLALALVARKLHLKGRVGKQCRERWFNHLYLEVKKGEWTAEEDLLISEGVKESLCLGRRL